MRSGMRAVRFVALAWVVAGCDGGPDPTGCDGDEDCPSGQHCAAMGRGCTFECREDRDCLGLGAEATCDERGRCDPSMVEMDGGTPPECVRACDDGVFCNGLEACDPSDPSADADGCVTQAPICDESECVEATERCDSCLDPDADDDGFDDVGCPGGRDCNDADSSIPSRMGEVCDPAGVDEDCNPVTVASAILGEDADGDGHFPIACCNGSGTGARCGDDCSDDPIADPSAALRHAALPETCDGVDNDCDERVDEGQQVVFYRDADGDGYGVLVPEPVREPDGSLPVEIAAYARLGCITRPESGWSLTNVDCDDDAPLVRPFGPEDCTTSVDDNCSGSTRDGCSCVGSETLTCGGHALPPPGSPPGTLGPFVGNVGNCRAMTVTCTGGAFPACVGQDAAPEACGGADEDCDGTVDEGVYTTCDGAVHCTAGGMPIPPEPGPCNYRNEDCDGRVDEGHGRSCRQTWNWAAGHFPSGGGDWELFGSATTVLDGSGNHYVDFFGGSGESGAVWLDDAIDAVAHLEVSGEVYVRPFPGVPFGDGVAVVLRTAAGVDQSHRLGVPLGPDGWTFEVDYGEGQVRIARLSDNAHLGSAPLVRAIQGNVRFQVIVFGGVMALYWGLAPDGTCDAAAGCSQVSGNDTTFSRFSTPSPASRPLRVGLTAGRSPFLMNVQLNHVTLVRESIASGTWGFNNCDTDYCP